MTAEARSRVDVNGRAYTIERWGQRFRWVIRAGDGRRLRRSFATLEQAERELRLEVARADRRRLAGVVRTQSGMTFGDVVDAWYARKQHTLDDGGRRDYAWRISKYVPPIATWAPDRIRRADIEDFYATLTPHSAHRLHTILAQAFDYAMQNDWVAVAQNPFRLITPVRPPSEEVDVPEPRDVEKLLLAAEDHRWYMFLRLSSSLATRRSETVAMRWTDVDFGRRHIHVRAAFSKLTFGLKLPKTHERRMFRFDAGPATDELFDDLWVYRLQYPDGGFLFPAQRAGSRSPCWHPDAVTARFARTSAAAGLPYRRVHSLRHFVATQLLELGWSPMQVALWLGHRSDSQVRRRYANHIREDAQRGIGAAAAGLVYGDDRPD